MGRANAPLPPGEGEGTSSRKPDSIVAACRASDHDGTAITRRKANRHPKGSIPVASDVGVVGLEAWSPSGPTEPPARPVYSKHDCRRGRLASPVSVSISGD